MNISSLWTEIEEEHSWRLAELRFFQNQIAYITASQERNQFRKGLILLLYAHFEGFCKFALSHYIRAVNSERLECKDVNFAIAASCLSDIFKELRNPDSKSPEFKRALPDDSGLHRFAREREFLELSSNFESRTVEIPDDVIDTESNLKPVVLRKNLYKIGLQHDRFRALEGQINKLLNYRNSIAHGSAVSGINKEEYDSLRDDVFLIMIQVKRDVMAALSFGSYLRR